MCFQPHLPDCSTLEEPKASTDFPMSREPFGKTSQTLPSPLRFEVAAGHEVLRPQLDTPQCLFGQRVRFFGLHNALPWIEHDSTTYFQALQWLHTGPHIKVPSPTHTLPGHDTSTWGSPGRPKISAPVVSVVRVSPRCHLPLKSLQALQHQLGVRSGKPGWELMLEKDLANTKCCDRFDQSSSNCDQLIKSNLCKEMPRHLCWKTETRGKQWLASYWQKKHMSKQKQFSAIRSN